jgi:carboxyl-terminal processing protease
LFSLTDRSSIKITIANWLTPKGEQIDGNGIKPDIEVKMTAEDYNNNKDPQLDKAVEIISSKI